MVLLEARSTVPLSTTWELMFAWVFISGFIGFILMGLDKAKAQNRARRIPEKSFFWLAFIGGAFGIFLGSSVFHHKTLKASFMGVVLIAAVVWLAVLIALVRALGPPLG